MQKRLVTLTDCPPGPFIFEGKYLGFKTEYNAIIGKDIGGGRVEWEMTCWPDAYVMDSGESFWGGTPKHEDRAKLLVQPVDLEASSAKPYDAEERGLI